MILAIPSSSTVLMHAAVVASALFFSRKRVRRLQARGEQGTWSHLVRIGFAILAAVAVRAAQSTTAKPLLMAAGVALLPLGKLPWLAFAGTEGEAISTLSWQLALLGLLLVAWALPFYALGLAAGFAMVRRPTSRLRRATSRLLVASGALLLGAYAGTSWLAPAGLDLDALRNRVATTGVEPSLWPLALVVLGLGMRWLFPLVVAPPDAPATTAVGPAGQASPTRTSRRWGW